MDYLTYKIFKNGRKTYLVFDDISGHEVEYKIVANRHFKVRSDNLVVDEGVVFDGTDLYWFADDAPKENYKGYKVVKVVYVRR